MKILFVNFAKAHEWGGGEAWTIYTARGLADLGHEVKIVGRTGSHVYQNARSAKLDTDFLDVGIDYSIPAIRSLRDTIKKFNADIVIVHHNKDLRTAGVAAKLNRTPVVHRNGFPILRNNWRNHLSYRMTSRILTNSQRIKDHYSTFSWIDTHRIDVVPNGVSSELLEVNRKTQSGFISEVRSQWGVQPGEMVVAYAGRLTKVKRVEDLVLSIGKVKEKFQLKLVIIGAGGERERLVKAAVEAGVESRVYFTGFKENASKLLIAADLVALPSAEEGMPNMLMEAMALGVPVAATPVGDVPYLLDKGNAGWLIPVGNIEQWTDLLHSTKANPGTLDEKGLAARERIKSNFSMEKMLKGIELSLAKACNIDA